MTRVKICGLTRAQDVEVAVDAGADAVGFILEPSSPRCLAADVALDLAGRAAPFCTTVAVYGHAVGGFPHLQAFQAHSFASCPPGMRILVHRLGNTARADADAILLDAFQPGLFGGTGTTIDWDAAAEFVACSPLPVILAGGLTPDNVGEAIRKVRPAAVDVASGVEISPGVKDAIRIRDFVQAARG